MSLPEIYHDNWQTVKPIFIEEVNEFVEDSKRVAEKILKPKVEVPDCSSVMNSFPVVYSPRTTIVVGGGSRPACRENDDTIRVVAGIIGALAAGFGLFKLGEALTKGRQLEGEREQIRTFKSGLHELEMQYPSHQHIDQLSKIAGTRKALLDREDSETRSNTALLGGAAASGAILVAGAIAGSGVFMAIGLSFGLVGLGSALFKWGVESMDTTQEQLAGSLKGMCERIQRTTTPILAHPQRLEETNS